MSAADARRAPWYRSIVARALLGAVVGTAIGAGAAVAFGQHGLLAPDRMVATLVIGTAVGLALALVPLPRWLARTIAWGSRLTAVVGLVALWQLPVAALPCDVRVDPDGSGPRAAVDGFSTTAADPLVVELEDGRQLGVTATADVSDGSALEVTVAAIEPPLIDAAGLDLLFERIDGGRVDVVLDVIGDTGPTGFVVRSADGRERAVPTFGTTALQPAVRSSAGEPPFERCDGGLVHVQFVTSPLGNLPGQLATVSFVLGMLALPATMAGARGGSEPLSLRSTRQAAGGPDGGRPTRTSSAVGLESSPVPARGAWHLPGLETRVVDVSTGRVVPPDDPLVLGATYQLQVSVGEGLSGPDAPSATQLAEIVVHGDHHGVPFEPVPVGASTSTAVVGFVPTAPGTATTVLDVVHRGHLVRTERVTLPVVEPGGTTDVGQSTRTSMAGAEMTSSAMTTRTPRDVLVVVDVEDGRVRATLHTNGTTLTPAREPADGATVAATARLAGAVRETLTTVLADGGGVRLTLPSFRRDEDLLALASVGRQLRLGLLGPDPDRLVALRAAAHDGAIVQVVQETTALGAATLPYQLLYDLPLSLGAAPLSACSGDHALDTCPRADDLTVVCPSGLWGHRVVVEEVLPRTKDARAPLGATDVETAGGGVAFIDPDERLHRDPAHPDEMLDIASEIGLTGVDGLDDLVAALTADTGLVYLYGHTGSPAYVEEIGFRVGAAVLLGSDLRERRLRRPAGGLVVINACGSGVGRVTDVETLVRALLEIGSSAVVATETTMWAPFANHLARDLLLRLAQGEPLGRALLDQRRVWWRDHGNHVGLTFRLHGLADVTWGGRIFDVREQPVRVGEQAGHGEVTP